MNNYMAFAKVVKKWTLDMLTKKKTRPIMHLIIQDRRVPLSGKALTLGNDPFHFQSPTAGGIDMNFRIEVFNL